MKEIFNRIFALINKPGIYLITANILLVFFSILLSNLGILPVKNLGNFIFFVFLLLLFALYRPGWAFLFFVGTIALENINVAPAEIGFNIRPYQLFGTLTIIAVAVRFLLKRLNFKFIKLNLADYLVILIAVASYVTAVFSADKGISLKQSLVLTSFAALYFLTRNFIQSIDDLKKVVPFFLSSSVIVVIYGIWQNARSMKGLGNFETMPGRPNATFAEADWLGIYLVLLIAVIYTLLYYFQKSGNNQQLTISNNQFPISNKFIIYKFSNSFLFLLLTSYFLLLTLTVSRSAWLGAAVVSIVFLSAFLIKRRWKQFFSTLLFIAIAVIWSIGIVYVFHLTNFQLFNRIQSTGTGLQKITVSCDLSCRDAKSCVSAETIINDVSELEKYDCRHINLEEIETEKSAGRFVTEIYRKDPNVAARGEIYKKSWAEIKKHPILGIGWGNIGNVLGKDERGITLNSSNIFLEVWLGSGILGLLAFILIWVYILIKAVKYFLKSDLGGQSLRLFLFLGAISLLIPNLFNAGIFIGILWLFFGISNIKRRNNDEKAG